MFLVYFNDFHELFMKIRLLIWIEHELSLYYMNW
jgi:hypothetical protein